MGLPIADLQDMSGSSSLSGFMTGTFGKLLGGAAGLLLIIKLVTESFYFVPVGHRGVKLRGGHPIRKREWRKFGPIALRCGPRTGPFKIKRGGIGIKIPFYHNVEKVNIQERSQVLRQFIAECPDGQRKLELELITRIPCELDGPDYADYPARVVITSSEPDQIFESYAGTALRKVLKVADAKQRDDQEWLTSKINEKASSKFDRVGYRLLDVNLREDALTPIGLAVQAWDGKYEAYAPDESIETESDQTKGDNVYPLPHPVVVGTVDLGLSNGQSS